MLPGPDIRRSFSAAVVPCCHAHPGTDDCTTPEWFAPFYWFAITMVDILNGAAYLFDKKPDLDSRHWKVALELEEYRHVLKLDVERSGCENVD